MTYISAKQRTPTEEGIYDCIIHRAKVVCLWKNGRFEGIYDQSAVRWLPKEDESLIQLPQTSQTDDRP